MQKTKKNIFQDIGALSTAEFLWWPRLQLKSLQSQITLETVNATFTGFGSKTTDQQVSLVLSAGAPNWIAKNQEFVSDEVQKVIFGVTNEILKKLFSLDQLLIALFTYNPAVGC